MTRGDNTDREPDIVQIILQLVQLAVPSFSADKAREIEQQVREQYGGLRTRIPKRKKHPTPEQRRRIFQAALADAESSTDDLSKANGIGRATLYRYLKRGGD